MQIHEIRVSLEDFPRVVRHATISAYVLVLGVRWAHRLRLLWAALTFGIRDADLELNIVPKVGILPHQELNLEWEVAVTELVTELVLSVLGWRWHIAQLDIVWPRHCHGGVDPTTLLRAG